MNSELIALETQRWTGFGATIFAFIAFVVLFILRFHSLTGQEILVRFGVVWILGAMIWGFGETLKLWSLGPTLRILLTIIGSLYVGISASILAITEFRTIHRIRHLRRRQD